MSKRIRPRCVVVEKEESAITFEYFIEVFNEENGEVISQAKQVKIQIPTLSVTSDLKSIALKVISKCKYMPEKWTNQIIDALKQIQQRSLNVDCDIEFKCGATSKNDEWVSIKLESNLELLYGDENEKQKALANILKLCMETRNLDLVVNDHSLMSALSRVLSDQASNSRNIVYGVVKIFLSLADFEDFHDIITKYRIGVLVVGAIHLEVRRTDQIESDSLQKSVDWQRNGLIINENILFICFQILYRITDNEHVLLKVLRKKIAPMLCNALRSSSNRLLNITLILLLRATIYEEVIDQIKKEDKYCISMLVSLLTANDVSIARNALWVVFNLSFDDTNLLNMKQASIVDNLVKNNKVLMKSTHRYFGIIYHLSSHEEICKSLRFEDFIAIVGQCVLSKKTDIPHECAAFIINMTEQPLFAEAMMPWLKRLLHRVIEYNDVFSARILRNLSVWTRNLQIAIESALERGENNDIVGLTKDASKYVKHIERECPGECPMYFNNYRSFKYWNQHIENVAMKCSSTENEDLLLQLMGVLNHLTINDMISSLSWNAISQKASLCSLIRRCVVPGMSNFDLNLEAVILSNQICSHSEGAHLFRRSKLLSAMIGMCSDSDEDSEILLQVLCLCETLISYTELRTELLLDTDALQIMFDCLNVGNGNVQYLAERCLDMIENYDRDQAGENGRFGSIVKERRFIIENNDWLKGVAMEASISHEIINY